MDVDVVSIALDEDYDPLFASKLDTFMLSLSEEA
jgi:hypothetical protein